MSRIYKIVVRYKERGEQSFRWTYHVFASGVAEARQQAVSAFHRAEHQSSAGCARQVTSVDAVEHLPDGMVVIQGRQKSGYSLFRILGLPGGAALDVFAGGQEEALERALDLCGQSLALIILDNGMSFFVDGDSVRKVSAEFSIASV